MACDQRGRITLLNPVAEAMTGWTQDAAQGRPLHEVICLLDPVTRQRLALPTQEIMESGERHIRSGYVILVAAGGEELPVVDLLSSISDDGHGDGAVLVLRDVREEIAARQEIEHQNSQLRSLGEAIPDLLFTVSVEGMIRYIQRSAHPDLLVSPEEIPRSSLEMLFEPELAAALLAAVQRAVALNELQTVEYPLLLPSGENYFEARMTRMSEREATVMVRNVTAERIRQQMQRLERERLDAVLRTTSAIIYSARLPELTIEYVSESAESVLGFPVAAFSAPGFWTESLHPDDRQRVIEGLSNLFSNGRHVHEYRHRHRDGSYRWLRDELHLVSDESGQQVRAVGASFDVTERLHHERRLASLLAVQQVVSRISSEFLLASGRYPDEAIRAALADIGAQACADRAYIFRLHDGLLSNTHEWVAAGVSPQLENLQRLPAEAFGYTMRHLLRGQSLIVPSVLALPEEAAAEREILLQQDIHCLLVVPLQVRGQLQGFLGVDNPSQEHLQAQELVSFLQLLADTVAAGLQRIEDELSLHRLNARLTLQSRQQRRLLALSEALLHAESRQQLLDTMRERLRDLFAVERLSLIERSAGGSYRLLTINQDSSIDACGIQEVNAGRLVGTALAAAMDQRVPITTLEYPLSSFVDWVELSTRAGLCQFIIVPLLGSQGAFGTLNLGTSSAIPLTEEDVDWATQVGSMVAAYMCIQEGREALQALNVELEDRVLARTRQLRESEERFQHFFQLAPQAMLILDAEQRVVQSNKNAQQLFSYDDAALSGLSVGALLQEERVALVPAQEPGAIGQPLAEPVLFRRRDGSPFSAAVGLVPLETEDETLLLAGITDISQQLAAQEALQGSLREKVTLLKEVHHRVKNNLQIISSLLMLQGDQTRSERARTLLRESVFRVRSMALIHEQLYSLGSLERVDIGHYAETLASSLRALLAPEAHLEVHAASVWISVEQAVPLGLILNELLTNAFKYGCRASGLSAAVRVEVSPATHGLEIRVLDGGPGLPPEPELAARPSLGLKLVRALCRQIRGELVIEVRDGTCMTIRCPAPLEAQLS